MDGHSARSWRTRALMLTALIASAASWPGTVLPADNDQANLEHRVKAAFLYKIAGYVEWPSSSFPRPDTPLTIGVVAADPLAAELSQVVTNRTANNRPITVRRLKGGEPLDGIHVLFVGRAASAQLPNLVSKTQQRSILVVTESDGALAYGSAINFILSEGRVRFEISLESARKSGVKLSSRLLAVAEQVYSGTP